MNYLTNTLYMGQWELFTIFIWFSRKCQSLKYSVIKIVGSMRVLQLDSTIRSLIQHKAIYGPQVITDKTFPQGYKQCSQLPFLLATVGCGTSTWKSSMRIKIFPYYFNHSTQLQIKCLFSCRVFPRFELKSLCGE